MGVERGSMADFSAKMLWPHRWCSSTVYIGYECQSASNKIAVLMYKVLHDTAPRYRGPLDRVANLQGQRALRSASSSSLVVPMFRLSSTFLDLGPGMDCLKTLFRCRHFQVSSANLNPSSFSSHILILSSNCTFDTIVVLVVMFITLGHSKNHWTELKLLLFTSRYTGFRSVPKSITLNDLEVHNDCRHEAISVVAEPTFTFTFFFGVDHVQRWGRPSIATQCATPT